MYGCSPSQLEILKFYEARISEGNICNTLQFLKHPFECIMSAIVISAVTVEEHMDWEHMTLLLAEHVCFQCSCL